MGWAEDGGFGRGPRGAMGATMAAELRWIRSSYSSSGANNCLECASNGPIVWIRDSKDDGPRVEVPLASWRAFLAAVI